VRLIAAGMPAYTVTAGDALWLARAVEAEGAVQAQIAATLVNGFCFARARGYTRSLETFVRAYAQPVNPRWYATGDLFAAQLGGKTESQLAELRKAAERREQVHSTRIAFSPSTQAAVRGALNGISGVIPPTATDYAAPDHDATGRGYTALTDRTPGVNRLWSRPGADAWAGYLIDATDAWPWLVGIAVVGFVAWRHWGA